MKIGIYGGTFSPPHMGHVRAADEFVRSLGLDKLLIIPTFVPPHKEESEKIAPEMRLTMCRLAFSGEKYEVSDIEIRRGGKSFTAVTLDELKRIYPDDELYLLCGTDMILTFDTWYRFRDIFDMCTVVCVRRECDADTEKKIEEKISFFSEQFGAKIRHISLKVTELSSSEIRSLVKGGENISELVPSEVEEYIHTHSLYR